MSRSGLLVAATIPAGMVASGLGAAVLVGVEMASSRGPLDQSAWLAASMIFMAAAILATPLTVLMVLMVGVPLACWRGSRIAAAPMIEGIPLILLGAGVGSAVMMVLAGRGWSPADPDRLRIGLIFGAAAATSWVATLRLSARLRSPGQEERI